MGTRHLTCVALDGDYKVAQYGQWDGYPSGQGVTALGFLRGADLQAFKAKVQAARWISDNEIEALKNTNWQKTHPQLSRDPGAAVLEIINDADPGVVLQNNLEFAADSLMCEYVYVIDFDKGTFEVFKGFNKTPLAEGERFASLAGQADQDHRGEKYSPVKHVHTFQLAGLPTEQEFLAICEPEDEDE
tara:strand:+ start:60074 stop:60637 length:564 start_codon:yes stop_codon:yes gene_type:complete